MTWQYAGLVEVAHPGGAGVGEGGGQRHAQTEQVAGHGLGPEPAPTRTPAAPVRMVQRRLVRRAPTHGTGSS